MTPLEYITEHYNDCVSWARKNGAIDAEDLIQEIIVKFMENAPEFKPDTASVGTFVLSFSCESPPEEVY